MLPWQPLFNRFFQNFKFSRFHWKNYNFSEESFTFLYHFRVLLLISVTFWSMLANFKGPGNTRKFKMAAMLELDVIVMSYAIISLCCGTQRKHFSTYYLPSKFRCHSLNNLGIKRWGPSQPHPVPEDQKKPGLSRVKGTPTTPFFLLIPMPHSRPPLIGKLLKSLCLNIWNHKYLYVKSM